MSSVDLGRLSAEEVGKPIVADDPTKQMQAVLSQLDALQDAIQALAAAAGAGGGVAVAEVDDLQKIELKL